MSTPSDAAYWQQLYATEEDGWEIGRAAPPLARYFSDKNLDGKNVLVPGCGRGYDVRMLAARGAHVVGLDIAEYAIGEAGRFVATEAIRSARGAITYVQGDLFSLRGRPAKYDLVVEHTCFCAIEPTRRDEYVDAVADALLDGGQLVALFYAHGRPGGPPFTTTAEELAERFARRFTLLEASVAPDSIARRMGMELLRVFVPHQTHTP